MSAEREGRGISLLGEKKKNRRKDISQFVITILTNRSRHIYILRREQEEN